jgi:hypothetical protein
MSAFLIPSMQAAAELQRTHERTFAIELKEDQTFVLYLKLTPTQTLSVINGAPIDLVIGSPVVQPNTISFRLNDVIAAPFWISRKFEPNKNTDQITEVFSGLPYISEQLVQAPHAQIGLFDWNTRCIHTEFVPISKPKQSFREWVEECQASRTPQITDDQGLEHGYVLNLGSLVTKPDFIYTNIPFRENVGDKPYLISTNKYSDYLYTSGYLEEGKHGYYQEYLLSVELAKYFRAGVDLFISPRTRGGAELTDFVIAAYGVVVLIESKASRPYEGTARKPKTVEKSLTGLVRKAFEQLQSAQQVVTENPALLEDIRLYECCVHATVMVGICIVDDALMINPRSLKTSLNQLGEAIEEMGAYILEFEDFFGLLEHSESTKHLIDLLVRLSRSIPRDADVPLFHIGF